MASSNLILIVDDQSNVRTDLKFWLERSHYRVHTAVSLSQAKVVIDTEQIDFAIVDLKLDYMSEFGGLDVVTLLKERHPAARTIILSAKEEDQLQEEVLTRNIRYDAFVWKGDERVNYIEAVTEVLDKLKQLDPAGLFRGAFERKSVHPTAEADGAISTNWIRRRTVLSDEGSSFTSMAWSKGGACLACADENRVRIWDSSGALIATIHHTCRIWCIAWALDSRTLLIASEDGHIHFLDYQTGDRIRSLLDDDGPVYCLALSFDGAFLASGGFDRHIRVWRTSDWQVVQRLACLYGGINSLAWHPTRPILASGSFDREVRLWDVERGKYVRSFYGHTESVNCVTWSPRGDMLASGGGDASIRFWDVNTGMGSALESHTGGVTSVSFSADGTFLASKSNDGTVRVWHCSSLEQKACLKSVVDSNPAANWHSAVAFHPRSPALALAADTGGGITLLDLDFGALSARATAEAAIRLTSAKVVLLGDANVGKTCVAHRLARGTFPSADSTGTTHGMQFWHLDEGDLRLSHQGGVGRREVVLWDMGGQEEYRLVHQLFLNDMTMALVFIDPTRGTKALEEAREWNKWIGRQLHPGDAKKVLVGAKQDTRSDLVDRESIRELCTECGFSEYVETSALTGRGIDELRTMVGTALNSDRLTTTSRSGAFQRVRDEIQIKRLSGKIVLTYEDIETKVDLPVIREVSDQLGREGVLVRTTLASSKEVLVLQVPVIERYAGSLILAARNNPRRVPVLEERLLAAHEIDLPGLGTDRLTNSTEERTVMECTIELMIRHGICFRHEGLLVFPTLFPKGRISGRTGQVDAVSLYFEFGGPIDNIYASLVARLMVGGSFGEGRLLPGRVELDAPNQGLCGVQQSRQPGGFSQLSLIFDSITHSDRRRLFSQFVEDHLRRHGINVIERQAITCPGCGFTISDEVIQKRSALRFADVTCPVCSTVSAILEDAEKSIAGRSSLEKEVEAHQQKIDRQTSEDAEKAKKLVADGLTRGISEGCVRLLHLSDLHFDRTTNVEEQASALLEDIRYLKISSVEYLVVTGDFTDKGCEEGFEKARQFIARLVEQLKLSALRCILVPGNHDLQDLPGSYDLRYSREDVSDDSVVQQGDVFLVVNEERYPLRFQKFSDSLFHKIMASSPYPLKREEQGLSYLFHDTGIQFLTFNSAWQIDRFHRKRSGLNAEAVAHAIRSAERDVARAVERKDLRPGAKVLRIGVWHHAVAGPEMMSDVSFLQRLRRFGVRLCLHGDVHEVRSELVRYRHADGSLEVVGAGSFSAPAAGRPESTPRLYNLLEVKRDLSAIRVHTRQRRRSEGAWEGLYDWPNPAHAQERRWYFDVDLRETREEAQFRDRDPLDAG
jgi:small GTP-binding protein